MIKVYREMGTIKAEQFDGSQKMINKYHISVYNESIDKYGGLGKSTPNEYIFNGMYIDVGAWIATDVNGEQWPIVDDVFRKTYAELPMIPKNVACLIKQDKERNYNLAMTFNDAYSRHIWKDGIGEWTIEHSDMFARAWLDGYQVEADE